MALPFVTSAQFRMIFPYFYSGSSFGMDNIILVTQANWGLAANLPYFFLITAFLLCSVFKQGRIAMISMAMLMAYFVIQNRLQIPLSSVLHLSNCPCSLFYYRVRVLLSTYLMRQGCTIVRSLFISPYLPLYCFGRMCFSVTLMKSVLNNGEKAFCFQFLMCRNSLSYWLPIVLVWFLAPRFSC